MRVPIALQPVLVSCLALSVPLIESSAYAQEVGSTLQDAVVARRDGNTVIASVAAQSLTFPISSSSGGFTSEYIAGVGEARRGRTFGSLFGERALTIGKGAVAVSFNYQTRRWNDVDGYQFDRDFSVIARFVTNISSNIDGVPMRAGESENFRSSFRFHTNVAVLSANVGLLDNLDLGVAIPFVDTSVSGATEVTRTTLDARTVRTGPQYRDGSPTHFDFDASSRGLGDIYLRPKFVQRWGDALAIGAMADLRFPTGSVEELRGLGVFVPKAVGILSFTRGVLSPYVNLGYSWGDGGIRFGQIDQRDGRIRPGCALGACTEPSLAEGYLGVSDEFNYVVGTEVEAHQRLTLTFDFIGRRLFDAARFERVDTPGDSRDGLLLSVDSELLAYPADIHNALGAVGFKWRISPRVPLLLVATATAPIVREGLNSSFSFTLGIEALTFGKTPPPAGRATRSASRDGYAR